MRVTGLVTLLLALLGPACGGGSHQPPEVPHPDELPHPIDRTPNLSLSNRDRAVLLAIIEHLRPNSQGDASRQDRSPVVVLSDVTLTPCRQDYARDVACVWPNKLELLERYAEWGANLPSLFSNQTIEPKRLSTPLGEGVVVVSLAPFRHPKATRRFSKWQLLQNYPPGSEFYFVSAPVYLSERKAILFHHSPDSGGGFCLLIRTDADWDQKECSGWTE